MKVTFTLKPADLEKLSSRQFSTRVSIRDRLSLLMSYALPLLFGIIVYIAARGQGIGLYLLAGTVVVYGVVLSLLAACWGLKMHTVRTNPSSTYSVEISEADLFCHVSNGPEHCHPWTHQQEINDWGDYFVFTSNKGQHLAVIPKSAFDDADHARTFFMQSRHYWEAAKNETVWPPAPHSRV